MLFLGALLSPALLLPPVLTFVFDCFILNHIIALVMLTAVILTIDTYRYILGPCHVATFHFNNRGNHVASPEYGAVSTNINIQLVRQAHARTTFQWTSIFTPLSFGPNLCLHASAEILQPALIGTFGKDAFFVAHENTALAAIGLVPPLCSTTLFSVLSDRTMIIFGLMIKPFRWLFCTCCYLEAFRRCAWLSRLCCSYKPRHFSLPRCFPCLVRRLRSLTNAQQRWVYCSLSLMELPRCCRCCWQTS